MRPIRFAFVVAAWLFVACVVAHVFLAGLGVFRSTSGFETHRTFAFIFGWLTLVMLVLALIGRLGRRMIGQAVLLLVLFSLQSVFVEARSSMQSWQPCIPSTGS